MARKQKSTKLQLGRTIAAERDKLESEYDRLRARQKTKHRKVFAAAVVVLVVLGVVIYAVIQLQNFLMPSAEPEQIVEKYEPTVEIVDESSSGYVTERMREYLGRLERDFYDLGGYKVERAVVPSGKMRELDVYLAGRAEYYKCNLDRGTAVTAEDVVTMIRYLDERELTPTYVDVRIEGRAYYR